MLITEKLNTPALHTSVLNDLATNLYNIIFTIHYDICHIATAHVIFWCVGKQKLHTDVDSYRICMVIFNDSQQNIIKISKNESPQC